MQQSTHASNTAPSLRTEGLGFALPRATHSMQITVARGCSPAEEILIRALAARELLRASNPEQRDDDDVQISAPFMDPNFAARIPVSCRREDGGISIAVDTRNGDSTFAAIQSAIVENRAFQGRVHIEDSGVVLDLEPARTPTSTGQIVLGDRFPHLLWEPESLAANQKMLAAHYAEIVLGRARKRDSLAALLQQHPDLAAPVLEKLHQALCIAEPAKAQHLIERFPSVLERGDTILAPRYVRERAPLLDRYLRQVWGDNRDGCRNQLETLVPEGNEESRRFYSRLSPYNHFLMHSIVPYGRFQWWQEAFAPLSALFQVLHGDSVVLPEARMDRESRAIFGETVGYRGALMYEPFKWQAEAIRILIDSLSSLVLGTEEFPPLKK